MRLLQRFASSMGLRHGALESAGRAVVCTVVLAACAGSTDEAAMDATTPRDQDADVGGNPDAANGGDAARLDGALDDGGPGQLDAGDAALGDAGGSGCALHVFEGADYTLSFEDSGYVASLEISADAFLALGNSADPVDEGWAKVVAGHVTDAFDFHTYLMNQANTPQTAVATGRNVTLHLQVQGTGAAQQNVNRVGFQAWPRLKAALYLGHQDELSGVGNVMHEIVHTWGNFLTAIPEATNHWPSASDVNGQLGGVYEKGSIHLVGPNTYEATWATSLISSDEPGELELYLMGFIPKDDVSPIHWLRNEVYVSGAAPVYTYTADELVTTTIDDLIAVEGPRVPDHLSAQHDFRMLLVVVTPKPLTRADWRYFKMQAETFGASAPVVPPDYGQNGFYHPDSVRFGSIEPSTKSFHKATRGIGSMDTSGLLDALVDADAFRCEPVLPPIGNLCARLLAKGKACGLPDDVCHVDLDFEPDVAECLVTCSEAADCDAVMAARENNQVSTPLAQCIWGCQ